MIFIASVLSWLMLQNQVALDALHRDEWLEQWAGWLEGALAPVAGSRVTTLVTLLLPVATLAVVLGLFGNWLFGLLGLVINVIALLYACGRGDYEHACSIHVAALNDAGENESAMPVEKLELQRAGLNYQAYERWFPVVFWFLILGAPGAVFYRLLACYAQPADAPGDESLSAEISGVMQGEIHGDAQALLGWFDWLPARLWGLACALAGNFGAAFASLSNDFLNLQPTRELLDKVVMAAADVTLDESDAGVSDTRSMANAVEQSCVLNRRVMVVALIFVLLILFIL